MNRGGNRERENHYVICPRLVNYELAELEFESSSLGQQHPMFSTCQLVRVTWEAAAGCVWVYVRFTPGSLGIMAAKLTPDFTGWPGESLTLCRLPGSELAKGPVGPSCKMKVFPLPGW